MGKTFANIGNVYLDKQDFKQAVIYFEKALKIFRETNDKAAMSIIYNNTSEAYSQIGDYKKATKYARDGLELAREVKDPTLKGHAMILLGGLNTRQEFFSIAEKNYEEALDSFKGIGNKNKVKESIRKCRICAVSRSNSKKRSTAWNDTI